MRFSNTMINSTETYIFTDKDISGVSLGDMLLFTFVLKAEKTASVYITVDVGTDISSKSGCEKIVRYTVPSQLSKIYIPVVNNGVQSISIKAEGTVCISEAILENCGNISYEQIQQKSGMWLMEDFEYRPVADNEGLGVGKTIDLVMNKGYIYSIGGGKLTVTDAANMHIVSTLTLTDVLRQIGITDDGRYVLVTCRQEGMVIVNVEEPSAPYIAACYNAVEFATGLYVSGRYAFVCNRQYGVEIVDISIPEEPRHLANIRSGEVQSCTVHNNILYAGVWGECGVYIYDLDSVCNSPVVEPVGMVSTNGKGDGLSVVDIGGQTYLFAATGHSRTDCTSVESPLSNLWHGQGNGMDIYNVSDPSNPFWVSGVHIDGRFYHSANDYWEAEVSYDRVNKRYYVYLVNTYNGVFVYDVTDIQAPKRLMQIPVVLPVCDEYKELSHNIRHTITPWDQSKERRSPVGAVAVCDGVMYIAAADKDLYRVECEYAFETIDTRQSAHPDKIDSGFYDFELEGCIFCKSDGICQAYAFAVSDEVLYLAAGNGGVVMYDKTSLELLGNVPSVEIGGIATCAYDVAVCDEMLYVADGIGGLRVYDVAGQHQTSPELLWSHTEPGNNVRQVVISPGGGFALIQYGAQNVKLIDINDSSHNVVMCADADGAMMYHRQISGPVYDRYICYWSHNGIEHWLDFGGRQCRFDVPVVVAEPFRDEYGGVGMFHGLCSFADDKGDEYVFKTTYDNRFVISKDICGDAVAVLPGAANNGMTSNCGDCIVVSNRVAGTVDLYKISGCVSDGSIKFILSAQIECAGNPDRAFSDGERLYIPLGYQGFVVTNIKNLLK